MHTQRIPNKHFFQLLNTLWASLVSYKYIKNFYNFMKNNCSPTCMKIFSDSKLNNQHFLWWTRETRRKKRANWKALFNKLINWSQLSIILHTNIRCAMLLQTHAGVCIETRIRMRSGTQTSHQKQYCWLKQYTFPKFNQVYYLLNGVYSILDCTNHSNVSAQIDS